MGGDRKCLYDHLFKDEVINGFTLGGLEVFFCFYPHLLWYRAHRKVAIPGGVGGGSLSDILPIFPKVPDYFAHVWSIVCGLFCIARNFDAYDMNVYLYDSSGKLATGNWNTVKEYALQLLNENGSVSTIYTCYLICTTYLQTFKLHYYTLCKNTALWLVCGYLT